MRRVRIRLFSILPTIVILLMLVMAGSVFAAPLPTNDIAFSQTGPYVTASSAINVRGGPGTGFYIIGALNQGEVVPVQGISPDGGWWYVNTRFGEGWVSATGVTASNTGGVPIRDPGPIGTVTTSTLTVRTDPGPNAASLGQLRYTQQVLVTGRNADGSWLQIRWTSGTGWVSAQYMSVTGAPGVVQGAVPVTADAPYGIVAAGYLNVRTGPGINYTSLGRVVTGNILPIVGRSEDGGWYQVDTVHGRGWVSARYIILRNEFGASPVTEQTAVGASVSGPIGVISTGALNLRSGPGPQYTDLGTLAAGEQGRIMGRSSDWGWWLLETRLGSGWVSSRYIVVRGDTSLVPYVAPGGTATQNDGQGGGSAPPPQLTGPMALIATGALNIRSGPNIAFSSLGSVPAGTRMPILGQSVDRGWWLVQSPHGNGWVSKLYVIAEGDLSQVPVTQ